MTESGPPTSPKRPTLSVVAQAARVSTATASKVLNNRPDVAPATRARVEAVLLEIGYAPSTGPREARRTPVVVVVFDSLRNLYSTQVLRGVLAASREMGVDIVVEDFSHRDGIAPRPLLPSWIQAVAGKGWLGVLTVASDVTRRQVRDLQDAGLFLVAIDAPNPLDDSVVSVGSTNFSGGLQATQHLLDLGHRRIAVAAGPAQAAVARERLHGYRSALEAANIAPDPHLVRHGEFTFEAGVAMGLWLLGLDDPPTAVLGGCDDTALGVFESARRLGVAVPQDLSIVGFDNTPAARTSAPPLTTVSQPMDGLGRVALRNLLQQAQGERPLSHHIQLATSLILRDSTAPPRTAGAGAGSASPSPAVPRQR